MTKPNGNVTSYGYYWDGLPKQTWERTAGGATVAKHDLRYNLDGDRSEDASQVDDADSTNLLSQVATYAYTPAGQLASVLKSGAQPGKNECYRYDAAGNTVKQQSGGAACDFASGKVTTSNFDRNRLTTTTTSGVTANYRYDPWGRLDEVSAAGTVLKRYAYDGFDRLVKDENVAANITQTTTYDAFDRVVTETDNIPGNAAKDTRYVYLGLSERVTAEEQKNTSGAWAVTKAYTYGPGGEKIGMVDTPLTGGTGPKSYYYGANPHGDVETLTKDDGTTAATYGYTAYGDAERRYTTGLDKITDDPAQDADVVNPYRFNGKRFDGTTGKYDMGFRDYDPGLNRYLSRDLYNGALSDMALGMDPWNTNRYAFAGGNPITGVELDGHLVAVSDGGGGSGGGGGDDAAAEEDAGDDDYTQTDTSTEACGSWNGWCADTASSTASDDDGGGISIPDWLNPVTSVKQFGSGIKDLGQGIAEGLACGPGARQGSCERGTEHMTQGTQDATWGGLGILSWLPGGKGAQGAGVTGKGLWSRLISSFGRKEVPQVTRNKAVGEAAEAAIAARYGVGKEGRQVGLDAASGRRVIDVLTPQGLAIESKVGRTSLTASTRQQIKRDVELLSDPNSPVSKLMWEFTSSPTTGKSGPSGPLAAELLRNGIPWTVVR